MSYDEAHAWEARAKREGVSKVARSQRGFMRFYEKFANKEIQDPELIKWWIRRRKGFVARHMKQYEAHKTPRRWLALVMWAYMPGPCPVDAEICSK